MRGSGRRGWYRRRWRHHIVGVKLAKVLRKEEFADQQVARDAIARRRGRDRGHEVEIVVDFPQRAGTVDALELVLNAQQEGLD